MKGLILSDIFAMKKQYILYSAMALIYICIGIVSKNASFVTAFFVMFGMLSSINIFSYNEQCKWDIYANTLPVRRKDFVGAKFILGMLTMAVMGVLGVAIIGINHMFYGTEMVETLFMLAAVMAIGVVYIAIVFILIFKMGVERSRMIMVAMYLVPFAVIMILEQSGVNPEAVLAKLDIGIIIAAMCAVAVVLLIASYFICVGIYNKKEL